MAFVAVVARAAAPNGITEEHTVHQLLTWCVFNSDTQRTNIFNDSLGSFDDIKVMK